jgi:cytochrome c peroxidase
MQAVEIVGRGVDGDGDGITNEMEIGDQTALAVYIAGQPRPTTKIELNALGVLDPPLTSAEITQINAGQAVFSNIGCADCHRPSLTVNVPVFTEPSQNGDFRDGATFPGTQLSPRNERVDPLNPIRFNFTTDLPDNPIPVGSSTLGNFERNSSGGAIVRLYGDLRRHFMGSGLAEAVSELEAGVFSGPGTATFLTENLWGVGSTAPYMHDGRATTITEAILEHGGEAATSRNAFISQGATNSANLVAFLNNLVLFKME